MANLFILGGPVLWPLLLFSIGTTVLVFERCWFWSRIWRPQQRLVNQILPAYRDQSPSAATILKSQLHLPIARIAWAALSLPQASSDEFRLALESAAQAELPTLKRFQTVFETVIAIAPLLGLLGTILGLIRVLSTLQSTALSQPSMGLASGIGEALISTAAGLVVAIATLMFANFFQSLYRRQRAFIQEVGGRLEIIHRRHQRPNLDRHL